MSITTEQLEQLKGAVTTRVPYISGVVPLPPQSTTLFFGRDGTTGQLGLRKPEDAQVQLLAKLCEPATFGRNQEDLLDETYRKAGKMDVENFGLNLDLGQLHIPEKIGSELLVDGRPFRWELYKLNVYGPGSFFKAHKDTPRSEAMFGSLVLVLPISHKGGELLLRTKEEVWTYDSAAILALQNEPSIGYVAFFGDIEHEVLPVESGHRITLTYNLFFAQAPAPLAQSVASVAHPFETTLAGLLKDPDFLTDGGLVGWGLKYEYPNLKGEDELVARISASLGLKAKIKVYIDLKEIWENEYSEGEFDDETWVNGLGLLLRSIPSLDSIGDESVYYYLRSAYGHSEVVRANEPTQPRGANDSDDDSDDDLDDDPDDDPDDDLDDDPDNDLDDDPDNDLDDDPDNDLDDDPDNDLDDDPDDDLDEESGEKTVTLQTGGQKKPEVWWLSEPTHACAEVPFASYGNEAQLDFIYGSFCLVIDIPSYATRKNGET
ncbi:iron/ascorbate-dependent oxidoreductase family protein [Pleurotus pulmonarius]